MITADPSVVIEAQRPGYVRYRDADGRRWEVRGTCAWTDPDSWGPCGEGSNDPPIGPPEGRLDSPVMPDMTCSLCIDGRHLVVGSVCHVD